MVSIGKILRSQGKNGQLKLRLYFNKRQKIFFLKVYIQGEKQSAYKEFEVESLKFDRNSHFLKLKGIDSLKAADALAGKEIFVPEESLGPPEEGAFYHFQILGSAVLTTDGKTLGTVKSLWPIGERTILIVEKKGGEILIPFTETLCPEVDPSRREIRVNLPDGLLELNEI